MRVAVSSSGEEPEAPVDPRFGRCAFYIIMNLPDRTSQVIANQAAMAMHGAGIAAAQMISQQGVQAVITGNVGPNAFQVLASSGIQVFRTSPTTVEEALNMFERKELPLIGEPSGPGHMGTDGGMGGMAYSKGVRGKRATYPFMTADQEKMVLENRINQIEAEVEVLKKRLVELETK